MLIIKRTGGIVFYLRRVKKGPAYRTVSNGKGRRDAAGNVESDRQWSRVQIPYTVELDPEDRDNLWNLYKDSDPILTPSGATNAFQFWDDELLTAWTACTLVDIEHSVGDRLRGFNEVRDIAITFECSSSVFDTNRRTA